MRTGGLNRQAVAWALYDWGNSAFATVVMAGFFPLFFRDYWSRGEDSAGITLHLGLANSVASILIMVAAPVLGAVADRGAGRKAFLLGFAGFGIGATGLLYGVPSGGWLLAAGIYVLANIGFMGANVFYDALLVEVAPPQRYDAVSALGFALGYLGGGLVFGFCILMTLYPEAFGLVDGTRAVRLSFVLVAAWWAAFSLPLALLVREARRRGRGGGLSATVRAGLGQLRETTRDIRGLRPVWLFLIAYWLYIDGVDTIVRMAVDYGRALGFGRDQLITALLVTQFVGFPAALAFGQLGQRLGTRAGILIGLAGYAGATIWGARMDETWEFYGLAVAIGLIQGGVQSLSRAFYARLIPVDKTAEFFGFYNMLGKFAAVLGPVTVGWVGALSGSPRMGILSLLGFFVLGGGLLWLVPAAQTRE